MRVINSSLSDMVILRTSEFSRPRKCVLPAAVLGNMIFRKCHESFNVALFCRFGNVCHTTGFFACLFAFNVLFI